MRRWGWLEVVLLILIGAALLWVRPSRAWRPYIVPDASEVYYATQSLVDRSSYTITVDGTRHPPRYSYGYSLFFLAPVYALTRRPELMFAVPMVCSIANMVLLYGLTRKLYGPGVAAIAGLLLPGLPAYYVTSWDLLSHAPSLTLFLLIALVTPRACAPSWRGGAAAGVIGLLGGLAITLRPTSILFLVAPLAVLAAAWPPWRRGFWPRAAAVAGGAAAFVVPLLWWNQRTFGAPTRTGYSYWCALIYDLPGQSFRFDLATLREGLAFYAVPIVLQPDLGRVCGLQFLVLVVAAGQVLVGLLRAWRSGGARRGYAVFALTTVGASLILYLPYTFRFFWFAHPAYACLLPFLASGLRGLWLAAPGRGEGVARRALALSAVLVLCLVQRWLLPLKPHDVRLWNGEPIARLKRLVPPDALFLSNRDPLTVYEELGRPTGRICVPLDRAAEYTWTQVTPRPPAARTAEAIKAVSQPVYPVVFDEDRAGVIRRFPGRRIFLETINGVDYRGRLGPGMELVSVKAGGLALYELRLVPGDGGKEAIAVSPGTDPTRR
jgi:hypothetical protein